MVRVRTADLSDILARTQHRFLDIVTPGFRHRQHRHSGQHSDHDSVRALSGNDPGEDADVRLADSRDGVPGSPRRRSADGCADHAHDRPLPGRTFLRRAGRGLCRDLDALLLDLRSSRSVRARDAGLCHRVRNHPGVFSQGAIRLPVHGGCGPRDRLSGACRCGRTTCLRWA